MKKISNEIEQIFKKILKTKSKKIKFTDYKIGEPKEWDSLNHVNLMLQIEKNFKVKFTEDEFIKLYSVNKLIKSISKKIKK